MMSTKSGKKVNVLSFDGGGSRGIMEIKILQHIMLLFSAMREDPQKVTDFVKGDPKLEQSETRNQLRSILDSVKIVIHPTEVFNFIVGTSVGSILSYLLVGGAEDPLTGERIPMSVQEVFDISLGNVPRIFKKRKSKNLLESIAKGIDNRRKLFTKFVPYSQDGLEEILDEIFGNTMSHEINYNGCIVGAVARQFNEDVNHPDVLEFFDSKSETSHLVKEIILGSTDAPIVFETPRKIGEKNYIDGGVAGNCPLVVALPRVEEIFGPDADMETVLSIATPDMVDKRLDDFKYAWQKSVFFIKYLSTQLTYGSPIFADSQKNYKNTHFIRATHKSKEAAMFQLDETDVEAMLKVIDDEFKNLPSYTQLIVDSAAVIAARTLIAPSDSDIDMFREIAKSMIERNEIPNAKYICKTVLIELNKDDPDTNIRAKMNFNWILAHCEDVMHFFVDALTAYCEAFELSSHLNEPDDDIMKANLMKNIGHIHRELGHLSESKDWLERSLQALKAQNAGHIDIADALNKLGNCLKDQGKLSEGLKCFQEAEELLDGKSDKDTVHTMSWVLNNMGITHRLLRQHDKARKCFESSLVKKRDVFGQEAYNDGIALTLNNLAGIFVSMGDLDQGKAKYVEVLAMKRAIFGKDAENTSLASSLHNLGNVCFKMGDYPSAQMYLNQALSMRKKFLGQNHGDVAKTLKVMGLVSQGLGDFVKAKQYFIQALEIARFIEGDPELILKLKEDLENMIGETEVSHNQVRELKRRESTISQQQLDLLRLSNELTNLDEE